MIDIQNKTLRPILTPYSIVTAAIFLVFPFQAMAQEGIPKNVAIYASKREAISTEALRKIAGDGEVKVLEEADKKWTDVSCKWSDVSIKLTRSSIDEDETLAGHLNDFCGYVYQRLAEGKMDAHVFHLIKQIKRTSHLYTVQADPNIDSENLKRFLQSLAGEQSAIIFVNVDVFDAQMKVLLGSKSSRDKNAIFPLLDSAVDRKDRTMKKLAAKELRPLSELPTVIADEQVRLRDAKAVARRAVCLCALAAEAEAGSDFDASKFLKKHNLSDELSPKEQKFLANEKRDEQENSSMTWRYEAVANLLWSIGQGDKPGFPGTQSDAKKSLKIVLDDPQMLLKNATLRPASEILDEVDLLYRCMWLCRDAQQNGKELKDLSMSVVFERLYALNWLIHHGNASWDKVQTDS